MDSSKKISPVFGRIIPIALLILLPILGTYLGFQAGKWYFLLESSGIFVKWHKLPDPPEKPLAMPETGSNSLYIETANGIYFTADVARCLSDGNYECWRRVDRVDKIKLTLYPCGPDTSRFKVASPPVSYVEFKTVVECGGEYYNEAYYLRSQAGELWVWQWGNFSMGMLGPLLFDLGTGMLVGLVAGILVVKGLGLAVRRLMGHRIRPNQCEVP